MAEPIVCRATVSFDGVARGDFVRVDPDDPYIALRIKDQVLVPLPAHEQPKPQEAVSAPETVEAPEPLVGLSEALSGPENASSALVLDVSDNAPVDEATFKASGAHALIAKATEVSGNNAEDLFRDPTYETHRAVAKACGVPFGAYLFLHATPTVDQAAFFLDYAKLVPGVDMDPFIDCEQGGTDGAAMSVVAARCEADALALEKAGWRPILYSSASFLLELYAEVPALKRLRVWEAQYPEAPSGATYDEWSADLLTRREKLNDGVSVDLWQWTDTFKVDTRGFDCSAALSPLTSLISKPAA